jgi:hypothetical protein
MSKQDRDEFMVSLEKQKRELENSKEARTKYLQSIGILNKSGKVSQNYKELCTPKGRG